MDSTAKVYKRARSRFWQLRWTDASGKEIRCSSGTEDYGQAVAQVERLSKDSSLSFNDIAVRFIQEHTMRPKTVEGYKTSIRAWKPYLGKLLLSQIGQNELRKFVSDRLKKVKPGTIRNDLACLSSIYTFAMMLPNGPENNPVDRFSKKHLAVAPVRIRWLSDKQVTDLLNAIENPVHKLIVLFGLEAGLRIKEILHLELWQIDLVNHNILLRGENVKSHVGRSVPISRTLLRALAAHLDTHKSDYLIVNPRTQKPYVNLRPWWPEALTEAGIQDFHFHDTRHHFASRYVQRGGRIHVLKELLGHGSVAMTEKYAYLGKSDAHDEFRRLDLS